MAETGNFPNGHGNKGGNDGNAFGAGRPKTLLRKRLLDGADKTAQYWLDVAKGEKVIVVPGFGNNEDTTRRPNHEERGKAFETLLRYGLGTQDEVLMLQNSDVFEAFGTVLVEFVAADQLEPIFERVKEILGGST